MKHLGGVLMKIVTKNVPEEKVACRKYHFVRLNPLIITCKSNIYGIFVIP